MLPDLTPEQTTLLLRAISNQIDTIKTRQRNNHPEPRQLRDLYLIEEYKTLYTHIKNTTTTEP